MFDEESQRFRLPADADWEVPEGEEEEALVVRDGVRLLLPRLLPLFVQATEPQLVRAARSAIRRLGYFEEAETPENPAS